MSDARRRALRTFLQALLAFAASLVPLSAAFGLADTAKVGAVVGVLTAAASFALNKLEEVGVTIPGLTRLK